MAGVCLSTILNAKNSTMTRNGMTPEQAVFGRSLRFTELSNIYDDQVLMSVLGNHGLAWKASQIRTAAKVMLLSNDALDKVRRAMLRQAPIVIGDVTPDSRVYFVTKSNARQKASGRGKMARACHGCGQRITRQILPCMEGDDPVGGEKADALC